MTRDEIERRLATTPKRSAVELDSELRAALRELLAAQEEMDALRELVCKADGLAHEVNLQAAALRRALPVIEAARADADSDPAGCRCCVCRAIRAFDAAGGEGGMSDPQRYRPISLGGEPGVLTRDDNGLCVSWFRFDRERARADAADCECARWRAEAMAAREFLGVDADGVVIFFDAEERQRSGCFPVTPPPARRTGKRSDLPSLPARDARHRLAL